MRSIGQLEKFSFRTMLRRQNRRQSKHVAGQRAGFGRRMLRKELYAEAGEVEAKQLEIA